MWTVPYLVTIIELVILTLGITFFTTQIIIPRWLGRPMLPMLRRGSRLESQMRRAKEAHDEAIMEGEITVQKTETSMLRDKSRQRN